MHTRFYKYLIKGKYRFKHTKSETKTRTFTQIKTERHPGANGNKVKIDFYLAKF